jgi:oligosaccharide reducing-end xylanase
MHAIGTAMDEMPASDGEEYFITALFFAGHQWGNGAGIYDYAAEARRILRDLKNRITISGTVNGSRQTSVIAMFNSEYKMVRFTTDTGIFQKNGDFTDPSYHLPAFYELWAMWGDEKDRAFWQDAAQVSRDFFSHTAHPKTGLTPDYAEFDGRPKAVSWDDKTINFRFDAWRVAMNWAVDAAWWAKDPREQQLSDRLLDFFASQGDQYKANYTLDGKPLVDYHSQGLVATNAVAALCATSSNARRFVDALYQAEPPTGKWRYYDGMLYLMSLLHVSGNFRAIMP